MTDGPQGIPCDAPEGRIFRALAEALGKPARPAPVVVSSPCRQLKEVDQAAQDQAIHSIAKKVTAC
jgi:hypothetical protein